jgi:holliday junction DNA helicase RuvA
MIVRLEGVLIEHDGSQAIVDCGGVGYGVTMCADDQSSIKQGSSIVLFISENIKEDAHDLYGFLHKSRRNLYRLLTSVNGVGPKAAMAILEVSNEHIIRAAIAEGNTGLLSQASGVGKKVAERIVVDLKNKVGLIQSDTAVDFLNEQSLSDNDEAVQALVALGYSISDAKIAMKDIDVLLPVAERVAQALRGGASRGN